MLHLAKFESIGVRLVFIQIKFWQKILNLKKALSVITLISITLHFLQYVLESKVTNTASVGLYVEICEIFHFQKCRMIVL